MDSISINWDLEKVQRNYGGVQENDLVGVPILAPEGKVDLNLLVMVCVIV